MYAKPHEMSERHPLLCTPLQLPLLCARPRPEADELGRLHVVFTTTTTTAHYYWCCSLQAGCSVPSFAPSTNGLQPLGGDPKSND